MITIDRDILSQVVARARRADAISPSESRAIADAEELLAADFEAQFPVKDPAPAGFYQPTLFDPTPYEV